MSEFSNESGLKSDAELEQLLRHASPRPAPDDKMEAVARNAVHNEWRKVIGRRRQRVTTWAVAASILVAVVLGLTLLRPAPVELVQVASIQKSFGSIYFSGEQSVLTRAHSLTSIHQGQTIVTDGNAGLALAWGGGGSVRIDNNSTVEFISENSIFLHAGRIYFDSMPSALLGGTVATDVRALKVETEHGVVMHVGTQFMTDVRNRSLTVSVREGSVSVAGTYYGATALAGQRVVLAGSRRPLVEATKSHGGRWAWVADTSPPIDVEGKAIHQFLDWAGRELGMVIQYTDDEAQRIAHDKILIGVGMIEQQPVAALRLYMDTTALQHRFDAGVIYVSIK